MVITEVKRQKNKIIVNIKQESFGIDLYFYECFLPYVNKEIDKVQYSQLQAFSEAFDILNKSYRKVFAYELSKNELIHKLKEKEMNEESIKIIISYLKEQELLDDEKLITHYKEKYQNKKGKQAFIRFLISKRIPQYLIDKNVIDYVENDDYALQYANRFIKQKTGSSKLLILKIKANLKNKGYSESTIQNVISNLNFIDEETNLIKDVYKYYKKYNGNYIKTVSKLVSIGYNVNSIKQTMKKEGMENENK